MHKEFFTMILYGEALKHFALFSLVHFSFNLQFEESERTFPYILIAIFKYFCYKTQYCLMAEFIEYTNLTNSSMVKSYKF